MGCGNLGTFAWLLLLLGWNRCWCCPIACWQWTLPLLRGLDLQQHKGVVYTCEWTVTATQLLVPCFDVTHAHITCLSNSEVYTLHMHRCNM